MHTGRFMKFLFFLPAVFLFNLFALEAMAASDAKVVPRLPPGDVLKRAAKEWETIRDYQGILHQTETHPDGHKVERWAKVTLVKNPDKDPNNPPIFLVQFYDHPVSLKTQAAGEVKDGTPLVVYFSDQSSRLFTYKPKENTLTIDFLENAGPLPEFLYIAGFVDFDLDEFNKKAYLDDETWSETLDGKTTYRVKAIPRKKQRDNEPFRYIWINKDDNMIKRFSVEGDVTVQIDFLDFKINQNLESNALIPEVSSDAYVINNT